MNPVQKCPKCGAELPSDTLEGMCPACIGQVVFGPAGAAPAAPVSEKPGDRIGRYKLREKIGEGGCGIVYVAEQEEPVRRKVALKIIKLGMDTKEVVARFEAERQALALMDHPNIARVFDGGATGGAESLIANRQSPIPAGRPYFVMELVRGTKITEFCDQNQLSTAERLKLFIQVCHAIQHAHQKGVIHRDIKPSNVLVSRHDDVPVPKVIDFGIAKAIGERLTEKTLYTSYDQFMGTPAYMSPEQTGLSDLDIDTRSDIYALGVLLYELLAGRPPFDPRRLAQAGLEAMLRTIREKEPPRPSTRLSKLAREEQTTTAQRRATEAPKLIHLLRGDLDWIVMKCLEKNRARRYETANALAQDIENHLSHQPVTARPPSTVYRVQKFVRRNKVMVTAGAMVGIALVLGITISTWQAVRANLERARAEVNEQKAVQSEAREAQQRQDAEAHAYAADMYSAHQALLADDLGKTLLLLDRYRPGTGREHLRGFEWRYLAAETRSEAQAMDTSSTKAAFRLALSPDGRTLAVGCYDGAIELRDPATLQCTATIESNALWATVAFSPKGDLLAATGTNGVIQLWQLHPTRVVGLLFHTNFTICSSFSPDGKHLAAYCWPAGVWIWNVESHQVVRHYAEFESAGIIGGKVCFSPDGRHLAIGDAVGRIHLLDWAGDRAVTNFQAHNGAVTSLVYSPDGRVLASGGGYSNCEILLWNPMTSESVGTLAGHRAWISDLRFSADGRWLVSGSADQTIRIWDVVRRRALRKLRGHRTPVGNIVLSPDNATILSGGILARWALSTNPPSSHRVELPGLRPFCGAAFLDDGNSVIDVRADGAVVIHDLSVGRQAIVLDALGTNNSRLAVAPKSGLLAYGSKDGWVRIWSLRDNRMVTNLAVAPGPPGVVWPWLVFSKAEDRFLGLETHWVGNKGKAKVWETQTWGQLSAFEVSPVAARAEFSLDGQTLVLGHGDGTVTWWDCTRGVKLGEARGHREGIYGLAFSPDGSRLASVGGDGTVALYDARTRRLSADWVGFFNVLGSVAFTPDGTRLATGLGQHSAVRLWDLKTRRELLTLTTPDQGADRVRFSPDGTRLLAAGYGGHCYVWTVPSLAELDAEYARQKAAR